MKPEWITDNVRRAARAQHLSGTTIGAIAEGKSLNFDLEWTLDLLHFAAEKIQAQEHFEVGYLPRRDFTYGWEANIIKPDSNGRYGEIVAGYDHLDSEEPSHAILATINDAVEKYKEMF